MPEFYCTSIAFSAIFGITTILHLVQAIYFKKKFCWVIVMAGIWETVSYVLRALSRYDINPECFGIPSQLLVRLAPLWVNAFVYMVFGRIVHYFVPDRRVGHLGARKLSLIFVLLDVLVGLAFIVVFLMLAIRCQVKLKATDGQHHRETSWRKALFLLYGALLLITIRIIYRLTEFAGGFDSGIAKKEPPFYILEATPMSVCMFLFNIYHPGLVLVGDESEFPKKFKKDKKSKRTKGATPDDIALNELPTESQDPDSRGILASPPAYEGTETVSWSGTPNQGKNLPSGLHRYGERDHPDQVQGTWKY